MGTSAKKVCDSVPKILESLLSEYCQFTAGHAQNAAKFDLKSDGEQPIADLKT